MVGYKQIFLSLYSRNYRLYFVGQGISLIGTWMQHVALSWLVYRLTGSVFLLGLIGFTSQIPTLVLAPFTGVITDRHNRLKLMILSQVLFMVQAGIIAFLVLINKVEVWHIVVLSLVFGIITAIDAPTRHSLVPYLVNKPEEMGNAIALNSAIFNGARLIGPAIAGFTISIVGEGLCFLFNALSYMAVIWSLLSIKITIPINEKSEDFKQSFKQGFDYTFKNTTIRQLIIHLALISLVGLSFIVLLPAYASEFLKGDARTLGYLMSALGAGALAGALIMASRPNTRNFRFLILVFTLILAVTIALSAFSNSLFLSMVMFCFAGLSMIITIAAINTLLQTIADDSMRGRVMSFYSMALMGTTPVGNLIAGSLASQWGLKFTLLVCSFLTAMGVVWFYFANRNWALR